jgi:hypothetical protein
MLHNSNSENMDINFSQPQTKLKPTILLKSSHKSPIQVWRIHLRSVSSRVLLLRLEKHRLKSRAFCDALDGTVYRIRFMPVQEGEHSYRCDAAPWKRRASALKAPFARLASTRKGLLRCRRSASRGTSFGKAPASTIFGTAPRTYFLMGGTMKSFARVSIACIVWASTVYASRLRGVCTAAAVGRANPCQR